MGKLKPLKNFKNNKAPGTDNIPAELLKFGSDRLKQWLKHVSSWMWINEEIPKEWLQGIIWPLHKKGDQLECTNYRGITQLNLAYKPLYNILYTRLLPFVESKFGNYQAGFCPRKSTIKQIFGLWQILEKIKEFRISIHLLYIDFKSAYDSIDREQMYVAMNELNIPKYRLVVKMIMSNMQSQIKIHSKLSAPFIIHHGV